MTAVLLAAAGQHPAAAANSIVGGPCPEVVVVREASGRGCTVVLHAGEPCTGTDTQRLGQVGDAMPGPVDLDGRALPLELYGPEPTHFLNHIRSISLTEDDGRWRFDTDGTVQPFEDTERYSARKVVDRFTESMLVEYCSALGLQSFDPAFYRPGDAVLVERIGPP